MESVNAPDDYYQFEGAQPYHIWVQEQLGVDLQGIGICGTVSSDLTTQQLITAMNRQSTEELPVSG